MKPLWRLDVSRDVQILKWAVPVLFAGLVFLGWRFVDDGRDVREGLAVIKTDVAVQGRDLSAINSRLEKIDGSLERIDEKLTSAR